MALNYVPCGAIRVYKRPLPFARRAPDAATGVAWEPAVPKTELTTSLGSGRGVRSSSADPPVGSCPPRFTTRTLDFFANDPPELVAQVNKNGDDFLCTMDFPAVSGHPGGNVIDNTAVGL